jgi:nitrogen fixation/metabolism regulation signal transduction histidine kinase
MLSRRTPSRFWGKATGSWFGLTMLSLGLMGIVLLLLLTQATSNRERYEQYYALLFWVNAFIAVFLLLTIAWFVSRLAAYLRKGKFGAKLLLKLTAIFGLVGLLPGLLIYTVSYQFVSRSIESWFDVRVEGALSAGLNLARVSLDAYNRETNKTAERLAQDIATVPMSDMPLKLERLRDQVGASELVLWSSSGRWLASSANTHFSIGMERLPSAVQRQLRQRATWSQMDDLDEAAEKAQGVRIQVWTQVPSADLMDLSGMRVLLMVQALPQAMVSNAVLIQEVNREYQERSLSRLGLKRMYIGTLTLTLFMAVFGALVLAGVLGNQLAKPLLLLARGMQQVAAGDLSPKSVATGHDELGELTRSFAQMTRQLAESKHLVQLHLSHLEAARASLQTILDNLTAGVILLGEDGVIRMANPAAERMLKQNAPLRGQALPQLGLGDLHETVHSEFIQLGEEGATAPSWQKTLEMNAQQMRSDEGQTLMLRGALLPEGLRLLVLDDITSVVSAQRIHAWSEVAKRLAHEIKNPLTPIQLSAERMLMKLSDRLDESGQVILTKSVKTIVEQVSAMQRLVNEFRDYARLPSAVLVPLNLNALVLDVLGLYGWESESEVGSALLGMLKVELDQDCPHISGDAQQLRQVIHNLLQNALDATAAADTLSDKDGLASAFVTIRTQYLSSAHKVKLLVQDSGPGFPQSILQRAFEPYVTTKNKGTGLGLAVVKKIADEHAARIEISNRNVMDRVVGAQVSLLFNPSNKEHARA